MKRRLRLSMLGLALILGASAQGAVDELTPHARVTDGVEAFLRAQVADAEDLTINVSTLDARLRLAGCASELEFFPAPGSRQRGATTVGVRCEGPRPWTLYVPATVQEYLPVLVSAHPIARGTLISESHLQTQRREVSTLNQGFYRNADEVLGMSAGRPIAAGTALHSNLLTAPRIVQRGEEVTILARNEHLEVRMRGEALSDGAQGERIRVRNLVTRSELEATVTAPGVVEVRM